MPLNLGKIFESGSKLTDSIGSAFDKNFTSKEEMLEAKGKILANANDLMLKVTTLQSDLIKTEMTGNALQRSWRPILMLCFGFIVMYAFFLQPAFIPNAVDVSATLPEQFWALLKIGMGGFVIGRSGEKIAKTVSDAYKTKRS